MTEKLFYQDSHLTELLEHRIGKAMDAHLLEVIGNDLTQILRQAVAGDNVDEETP